MRPECGSASRTSPRLLRPRGDAPRNRTTSVRWLTAPPPTRRCAPARVGDGRGAEGSSAHAEMRRVGVASAAAEAWLLRPRGDAPPAERPGAVRRRAPPPTRRRARSLLRGAVGSAGSSAHAEMRPTGRGCSRTAPRLLRPHGDPPLERVAVEGLLLAPHAEVRRCQSAWQARSCRFLRPRGDAPVPIATPTMLPTAPPPTRRCAAPGGPPCWAPVTPPPTRRCARTTVGVTFSFLGSSATRRCAHLELGSARRARGSSAHAEMRPTRPAAAVPIGGSSAHAEMRPSATQPP